MKKSITAIFLSLIFSSLFFFSQTPIALAQGILPPEGGSGKLKGNDCGDGNNCGDYSIEDFLIMAVKISDWILGIVGSVALLFFIFGGFMFILSGGSEEKVSKGKSMILNSVIGLILVFTSFLIIQFVMTGLGFTKSESGQWSNMATSVDKP